MENPGGRRHSDSALRRSGVAGASWGDDNTIIAALSTTGLWRIPSGGGKSHPCRTTTRRCAMAADAARLAGSVVFGWRRFTAAPEHSCSFTDRSQSKNPDPRRQLRSVSVGRTPGICRSGHCVCNWVQPGPPGGKRKPNADDDGRCSESVRLRRFRCSSHRPASLSPATRGDKIRDPVVGGLRSGVTVAE
jgi:hypothetical protein